MNIRSLDLVEVRRSGNVSPVLRVTMSHHILTDSAATCAVQWAQDSGITGRAIHPWESGWGRNPGVPLEVRAAMNGQQPERLFVGTADGSETSLKTGESSTSVVDRITRLQTRVVIPGVAWTMPPHRTGTSRRRVGLWGTWVTHHVMMRSGFSPTQFLQWSGVWFQSMAGSAWLASDPDHNTNTLGELTVCHRLGDPNAAPQVFQGTNTPCMENVYSLGRTRTRRNSNFDDWQLTVDMASDAPTTSHIGSVDLRTSPVSRGAGVRLEWTQTVMKVMRINTDGTTVQIGQVARALAGVYTMRWTVVAQPNGTVTLFGSDGRGLVGTWTDTGVALQTGANALGTVRVQSPGPISAVQVSRSNSNFLATQSVSAVIRRNTYSNRSLPMVPYQGPRDALAILKEQAEAEDTLLWVDRAGRLCSVSRELLEEGPVKATIRDTGGAGGISLNELAAKIEKVGPYEKVDVHGTFSRVVLRDQPRILLAEGEGETIPRGDQLVQFLQPRDNESWLQDTIDTSAYMAGNPYPSPTSKEFDYAHGTWVGGHMIDADGQPRGWAKPAHLGWSLNAAGEVRGALTLLGHDRVLVTGTVNTPAGRDFSTMPSPVSKGLPQNRKGQPLSQLRGFALGIHEDVVTKIDVTGDESHGTYTHEGSFWLPNNTWRTYIGKRLAFRALNPQPQVSVKVALDLGVEVGDRIKIEHRSTARVDLDCLVIGVSMELPSVDMDLDVIVLSGHDIGWDDSAPTPPPTPILVPDPRPIPSPEPPIEPDDPPPLTTIPKPSLPIATVDLDKIFIDWDGLTVAGANAVNDQFGRLEVAVGRQPNPSEPNDYAELMPNGWRRYVHGPQLPLDSTWYVRTRIVDPWDRPGPWSDQSVVHIEPLVNPGQFEDALQQIDEAAQWIADTGVELDQKIADAREDIDEAQAAIDEAKDRLLNLRDVVLPDLEDRISDAEGVLGDIPDQMLALQGLIDAAEARLDEWDTDRPAFLQRITDAEGTLSDLTGTTLPALQDNLSNAQGRLDQAFGEGAAFDVEAALAAAESAAKTHAEGKAEEARIAAVGEAATDAQAKADAAQSAAEDAAATHAELVAGGAKQEAIDAAAADAETKANAARQAAIDAAKTYADTLGGDLSARIDAAQAALDDLDETTVPALSQRLSGAEGLLNTAFPDGTAFDISDQIESSASATLTAAALEAQNKADAAAQAAQQAAEQFATGQIGEAELRAAQDAADKAEAARQAAVIAAEGIADDKASAAQQAAISAAETYSNTQRDAAIQAAALDAQTKANDAAAAAEQAAKDYAEAQASGAGADALAAAKIHAEQQAAAAQQAAEEHADAQAAAAQAAAATDATNKAAAAKQEALTEAAADALTKANTAAAAAEQAAKDYAEAQASGASDAALAAAKTHADNAAEAARSAAVTAAETHAEQMKNQAIDAAALTAQAKADVAQQAAIDAAAADATSKANAAQSAAISAAEDAAEAAQTAAQQYAAGEISEAELRAAQDAADKANAARDAAIAEAEGMTSAVLSQTEALIEQTRANAGRVWRQDTPPGTFYRWTDTPHRSTSEKVVDGKVVARNFTRNPKMQGAEGEQVPSWSHARVDTAVQSDGVLLTVTGSSPYLWTGVQEPTAQGTKWTAGIEVTNPDDETVRAIVVVYDYGASPATYSNSVALEPGETRTVEVSRVISGSNGRTTMHISASDGKGRILVHEAWLTDDGERWNGDTPYAPAGTFYRWTDDGTSEKVVDGEVESTNPVAGLYAWSKTGAGEIVHHGNNHVELIGTNQLTMPAPVPASVDSGPATVLIRARSVTPSNHESHEEDEAGIHIGWVLHPTGSNGHAMRFPADGEWHDVEFRRGATYPEGTTGISIRISSNSAYSSSRYELGGVRFRIGDDEDWTPDFDGDSPDDRANDLWINTAEGNKPYTWDSETNQWIVAADEAIEEVRGLAVDAADAADEAQQTADAAILSADGKNTVTYSNVTSNPGATPTKAFGAGRRQFDTHRNRLANNITIDGVVVPAGTVVAEWMWTGSAWTPVHLGDAMLRSLDVGRLTAGSAAISDAVIDRLAVNIATVIELNANRITAGTINSARINTSELAASIATIIELDASRIRTGTIDAGRIDVQDLAARIASVIELHADSITAGTIDAARIDVAALTVEIAQIITLDADQITSGQIDADRINVQDLAAQIASVIELNADRITAGTINSARINTSELAATLATIIELDASRIRTGTLNADRIDVSDLAARIATVIELNADRITAGKITADRIDVADLAVQIATVIELHASRITAGTINTDRLDAVEVAALVATFVEARLEKLVVTSGATINEAVIEKLWTDVVRSRKITTDMLLVGSGENLVVDPRFLDDGLNADRASASTGTWSIQTDSDENVFNVTGGSTRTLRLFSAPGSNAERVGPITPGSSYRIRYDHRRASGTSSQSVRPVVYYMRGTGVLVNSYPRSTTVTTTTSWQTDEIEWTAPDDAIGAYFGVIATGGTTATHTQIRRPYFTSMTDASLIVDGGIAARHINAESIAAAIGEFVTVKAENILAGNVNVMLNVTAGGKIVAGNPTETRTEMSATGIEHWSGGSAEDDPEIRVSRFGRDLQLIVPGGDGGIFGIDENGDGSVRDMSIAYDPHIAGSSLLGTLALRNEQVSLDTDLGHLDQLAFAGNHAQWDFGTSGYPWNSYGEKPVAEVIREQQAGRTVLVIVSIKIRYASTTSTFFPRVRIRKTELNLPTSSTPPRPTTSSPGFNHSGLGDVSFSCTGHVAVTYIAGAHVPSRSEVARWLVQVQNGGPSPAEFRVESLSLSFLDIGPNVDTLLDGVNRIEPDAAPTPPVVNPKKTYTSRWYANSIRRWQRPYETPSGDRSGQALQGWMSGMNGAPFDSIAGFTGTAHHGEVGRTITAVLANATVDRVRIRTSHVYGLSGIPPRLGIQSSSTATPTINQTVTATNPGQTLYHIMNSTFRNGLKNGMRYITFGPYLRSGNHYASYHGTSGGNSRRLELEITYTR